MSSETPSTTANDCPIDGQLSVGIDQSLLDACIHCGLCLPACPTYLATGREMESPRGRLYLMNLWQQGEIELKGRMSEHLESCLGCYGCQTACPSGVQYETLLNQMRPFLASLRGKRYRRILRLVLDKVLPDYGKLKQLSKVLRLWQQWGGPALLTAMPWLKKSFGYLSNWQDLLPPIPKHVPLPKQAWMSGEKTGQANLFIGCVMDIFYNQVNHACQKLLVAQRQITVVPEQTCCGALAAHAGEMDIAKKLAKRNIELWETQPGPIVVTAAGCGAMLKEYAELLADESDWSQRACDFSERVVDITEFLAAHQFARPAAPVKKRKVAYHAACHLYHAQKVRTQPQALLVQLPELELVPLSEAEHCCGSAGIFNLTHEQLSAEILQRKIEKIKESGAQEVVTTNPGCILQLQAGLQGSVKVRHLAELLLEAYEPD